MLHVAVVTIYWKNLGSFVRVFVFLWRKPDRWLSGRIRSTSLNKRLSKNQLCISEMEIKGKCSKKAKPLMGVWRWLFSQFLVNPPSPPTLSCNPPTLVVPLPLLQCSSDGDSGRIYLISQSLDWFQQFYELFNDSAVTGGRGDSHNPLFPHPLINVAMETK